METVELLGGFTRGLLRMLKCIFHLDCLSHMSLFEPIDDNKTDKFGKDESSIEGSKDSMDVDTMGFELEARISKLEEIFAYLKATKNGEMIV
ncbi:hypothetical protein Tco_0441806 [Tanacetum coccineum]